MDPIFMNSENCKTFEPHVLILKLRSTENKISKDKKGENVPHLEITEVVLVHCNIK